MDVNETVTQIAASYNRGDSLPALLQAVGTDDATLRLVHMTIGVAMSTLRREAAEMPGRD